MLLHVLSDLIIGLSYFAIPVSLWMVVRRDRELRAMRLFMAFIFLCGLTHLWSIYTTWVPAYYLEGMFKAATALISLWTALVFPGMVKAYVKNQTRTELEATRRKLEAEKSVLENALEGAIRLDAEGNLSQVNGAFARLMKSDAEVLRGVPWRSVIAPADHEALAGVLTRSGRTEVSLTAQRRDGRQVPVDLVVLRLAEGWAIFLRDMTRHRAMEARLVEHNAALQRFASTAAHDLQEPIRMIIGYLELIERRYSDKLDDSGHEFIEHAVHGAGRMERLIRELLKFTRLDAEVQTESCSLNKLVNEALDDLERLVDEAQATVEVGDLPTLEVQPTRLRQVFQNLLGNALKFRRPDQATVIRVGSERTEAGWVVTVQDNGIGIPADCIDQVFQPLFRGHSSEDYSGTGLGLATCQRIVAAHGGKIWAELPPEGGTIIRFSLPDSAPRST